MSTKKLLLMVAFVVALASITTSTASAHLLTQRTSLPATSGTGCFDSLVEFGEGGGGTIHMYVGYGSHTGAPCTTSAGGLNHGANGVARLMLMKYTGSGPYAGGYSICSTWNVTDSTSSPFGELTRHVDSSVSCGGGYYAAALCAGPSGYSSVYRAGSSSYLRSCSGNHIYWTWSPDWHLF